MNHRLWTAPALLLCMGLSACGSGGDTLAPPASLAPQASSLPFASLGELEDAIRAAAGSPDLAERVDTDGDSLPDGIEARLGTSPLLSDTDRDGLVDGFELFGTGFDRAAPLPDRDRDGLVSPRDPDDDGDQRNDGLDVDTDGDQVANYLEFYGYTYDILTGRFELWNGDPDVPHYFTDPLQPSTDQDAYPDGMEASGALLDPTVEHPGDDPLVPAYPNIVCELMGYTATLNADIQITETESLSEGRTWSRQTDRTSSRSVQNQWEIGGEASYGTDSSVSISAKFGQTYDNTNSTTNSQGSGESITSEEGWSMAQSSNPTSAAHMKLFLRVRNRGTAPLSDFKPTLTLKIGGLNVATFEPSGADVSLLVPGGTYPPEVGSYWVVDGKDTGGGVEPISLTITELRALERGAPVSIVVTQVEGETMRLTKGGAWESMGDANEFTARCDAVCANVRIELENGDLIHHLVYADEGPSAPPMNLGTALQKLGVEEAGTLVYFDENGTPHERSLEPFHFAFDPATLRANGWILAADDPDGLTETTAPSGFRLEAMRLLPDSIVYIRAPRDPGEPAEPTVHYATLDPDTGEIQVSAADYAGILSVVVYDEDRTNVQELVEYVPGAGVYTGNARGPGGFDTEILLTAEVENLDGLTVALEIGHLYKASGPSRRRSTGRSWICSPYASTPTWRPATRTTRTRPSSGSVPTIPTSRAASSSSSRSTTTTATRWASRPSSLPTSVRSTATWTWRSWPTCARGSRRSPRCRSKMRRRWWCSTTERTPCKP